MKMSDVRWMLQMTAEPIVPAVDRHVSQMAATGICFTQLRLLGGKSIVNRNCHETD